MKILSTNAVDPITENTLFVEVEISFEVPKDVEPTLALRRYGKKSPVVYLGYSGVTPKGKLRFVPEDLPGGMYQARLNLGACCCRKFDIEYQGCPAFIKHSLTSKKPSVCDKDC